MELAELIGLLHDIGRFEQIKRYNTFIDKNSINHGQLGVKILFDDNQIRRFIKDSKYDDIIKTAILNHNRSPKNMEFKNEKEQLHSMIIRDADKIDILYEAVSMFWNGEEKDINNTEISSKVMEKIEERELIKRDKNKAFCGIDKVMSVLAFIFDINYKPSFKIIKENDYINKIIDRFEFKEKEKVRNIALQYLQEKER